MKHLFFIFSIILWSFVCSVNAQQLVDQVDARFQNIERILVEGFFCDVNVEPGGVDEVHLKGEIRSTKTTGDLAIKTSQNGNELKVWIDHKESVRGNVRGFLMFKVPDHVAIKVNNVSGNVNVTNIGSDNMNLKTVSGEIFTSGAGANTYLKSVSGNITASVVEGPLMVQTVSGDTKIEKVKGAFTGQSTSGNFNLKMMEGRCNVGTTSGDVSGESLLNGGEFRATSGNILMTGMRGNLLAKTVSGDVRLSDVTGSVELWTTSGDQRGQKMMILKTGSFNSVSGDILMDLENSLDDLSFRMKSQSGDIVAGESKGEKSLLIEKGNVWIKAASTSGDLLFQ
ncbi:DUF4097 family beta strand repeat-containing protein [Thermophagus sp. OGC60D27]|uniref:DUF4097 family beta strand repeat-containing protein n=1 Tax=Thermophagus sp. OGC60D27 TaxID=3458415 RepID=UPI0040378D6F